MKVQRNNCQTVTDVIPYDKGNETQGNMYNIPFGNSLPLRVEAGSKVIWLGLCLKDKNSNEM